MLCPRLLLVLSIAMASLLAPAAATAQWRVLEKLSGPGPFDGVLVNWKLIHANKVLGSDVIDNEIEGLKAQIRLLEARAEQLTPTSGAADLRQIREHIDTIRALIDALIKSRDAAPPTSELKHRAIVGATLPRALLETGLVQGRQHETRVSVDLTFSYLWSRDNDLPYRRSLSDEQRKVKVIAIEPTVWVHARPQLQMGFSVGGYWFAGDAFDSFSRLSIQPVRLALMPLRFVERSRQRHDWLRIEWGLLVFPKGFTAAHFGAVGDFREAPDVLWKNVNIVIDFETLLHK